MNINRESTPSKEATALLEALQRAVNSDLERKRRLGQYAVICRDGKPVLIGDDAPGTNVSAE